jgi:hypothetical protein
VELSCIARQCRPPNSNVQALAGLWPQAKVA